MELSEIFDTTAVGVLSTALRNLRTLTQTRGNLLSSLLGDFPLSRKVTFIAHQNDSGLVPSVGFDLFHPICYRLERVGIGDVIHENKTHGATIISSGDCAVSLLSSCVLLMQ